MSTLNTDIIVEDSEEFYTNYKTTSKKHIVVLSAPLLLKILQLRIKAYKRGTCKINKWVLENTKEYEIGYLV